MARNRTSVQCGSYNRATGVRIDLRLPGRAKIVRERLGKSLWARLILNRRRDAIEHHQLLSIRLRRLFHHSQIVHFFLPVVVGHQR
jgi:hypothetical protein